MDVATPTVAAPTVVAPTAAAPISVVPPVAAAVPEPAAVTMAAVAGNAAPAPGKGLGASDIDFGCPVLRDGQCDASAERSLLEKQLQVAQTWNRVRAVDVSTAKFRLLSALPGEDGSPPQVKISHAEIEVLRCDLNVKEIELKIAALKEDELRVKLRDAWRKEGEEMQTQLATLRHTVETVKLYPNLIAMKPRTTFFFADCQHEGQWGIGRWYCEALSERPFWRRYPAEKWFVSQVCAHPKCRYNISHAWFLKDGLCLSVESSYGRRWVKCTWTTPIKTCTPTVPTSCLAPYVTHLN